MDVLFLDVPRFEANVLIRNYVVVVVLLVVLVVWVMMMMVVYRPALYCTVWRSC